MTLSIEETRLALTPYVDKIVALKTPRAIAQYLAAEGVKGRKGCSTECVLAVYLQRETGIFTCVSGGGQILAEHPAGDTEMTRVVDGELESYWLTQVTPTRLDSAALTLIYEFIINFDEGHYPKLEEKV